MSREDLWDCYYMFRRDDKDHCHNAVGLRHKTNIKLWGHNDQQLNAWFIGTTFRDTDKHNQYISFS